MNKQKRKSVKPEADSLKKINRSFKSLGKMMKEKREAQITNVRNERLSPQVLEIFKR